MLGVLTLKSKDILSTLDLQATTLDLRDSRSITGPEELKSKSN